VQKEFVQKEIGLVDDLPAIPVKSECHPERSEGSAFVSVILNAVKDLLFFVRQT
jgi:hypothetical protein